MKRIAAAAALGILLHAITMTPAQADDLRATPHNLARHGGASAADAGELCVFCHAPSASQTSPSAPRWQSALGASFAFPVYDDVGSGLGPRVGSHSVACLSCHDAIQAQSIGTPSGFLLSPGRDHAVGVPYGGPLDGAPRRGVDLRPASRGTIDGRPAWWVSSRGPGAARARSDLPLFLRDSPEGDDGPPLIECGTCHDPHATTPRFLRLASGASVLCLTCHDK